MRKENISTPVTVRWYLEFALWDPFESKAILLDSDSWTSLFCHLNQRSYGDTKSRPIGAAAKKQEIEMVVVMPSSTTIQFFNPLNFYLNTVVLHKMSVAIFMKRGERKNAQ